MAVSMPSVPVGEIETMMRRAFLGAAAVGTLAGAAPRMSADPSRLGMAGLVHGHAGGFLSRYRDRADIELVGVSEPDAAVAARYSKQFRLDPATVHRSIDAMLDRARPQAVVVFTSTADHPRIVAACADRKIPVMMEKPLAIGMDEARAIERSAARGGIPVLVNYETTWYPAVHGVHELATSRAVLGPIRKIVVHAGHRGPKEIGVQPEFLDWLTDPARNGAGALFDFGCYGANLATWLMNDARPTAVTAVTQRFKPEVYPRVDDEATILIEYPGAQAIVQASWNWPFDRKDLEVYGRVGQALTEGESDIRSRLERHPETISPAPALKSPEDDFLRYFIAVVRGEIQPSGLSSLKNNLIVSEILDAARRSAEAGRRVELA
jgi:predicted dehydrogenase